jgi:uncharacterized protein YbbC (DUF1343 family)/CubicO group peptidase (beta-lactamase class C family)
MANLEPVKIALSEAVREGSVPGGVVFVGRGEETFLAEAVGARRLVPAPLPMEPDTLFDVASLTKPVVTATLAMRMVEQGRLALGDPVAAYVAAFAGDGRDEATIRDLLTHSAGLPAWKDYAASPPVEGGDRQERFDAVVADICSMPLVAPPGERFMYSDLGFILLGHILERVSGNDLARLAEEDVFRPTGMTGARFNPTADLWDKCAATEVVDSAALQGVVHDENARYLGGVAGHAGLFARGEDLARFLAMMLRLGQGEAGRVLSAASTRAMTSPQSRHPGQRRGLGWDIDSDYAGAVRGDLFPPRGFGHSGFTGTSLWVDPPSGIWFVLLTNVVHPSRDRTGMAALRRRLANAVAAALLEGRTFGTRFSRRSEVLTGFEAQRRDNWSALRGKRLGMLVNHTAVDRKGAHLVDQLAGAAGIEVVRLFAPEHGPRGEVDSKFADGVDLKTGLPVVSLYGERQAPEPEQLADLDALVFDVQDAGVRFYTYTATMALAMRAAREAGVEMVVLDRPSLLRADRVAGPVLDAPFANLAEYHPLPVVHGMTAGELALYANSQYGIGAELRVVRCEGYGRDLWFDQTGLPWVNPSPNLRTPKAAVLYPAVGMLERCRISVGRGMDAPFEVFGAPWMDGVALARRLNERDLPGVGFVPVEFTPLGSVYDGERCGGCYVDLLDHEAFEPVSAGLHIARTIHMLWGDQFGIEAMGGLLGDRAAVRALAQLAEVEEVVAGWQEELGKYLERRRGYLLY